MHKVLQALSKADEAAQCYRQALALYHQMRVNVHESRDETRLAAGTIVVDSALPRGAASGPQVNVAPFPQGERFVENTFIGQPVTLPQGHMGPSPREIALARCSSQEKTCCKNLPNVSNSGDALDPVPWLTDGGLLSSLVVLVLSSCLHSSVFSNPCFRQ